MSYRQCPQGHYYSADLNSCPYCKSSSGLNYGLRINFNQTLIQCPKCGQFSPGPDKCIHCGANLFGSIPRINESSAPSNEMALNPKLCRYEWYRIIHRKRLEGLRQKAEEEYMLATLGSNPVERSEWYQAMRLYIDRKTDDIITQKQCYRYGLQELDKYVKGGIIHKDELGYCHAFWAVKKALIKQEYRLIWHTPQEMEQDTQFD